MSNLSTEPKPTPWRLILLLAPFVGVLWVPFFNRVDPELWSIPFFFWYGFLWVVIIALVTASVYLKTAPRLQPIRLKGPRQNREWFDRLR